MKAAVFLAGGIAGFVAGVAGSFLFLGVVALEVEKNRRRWP